MNIDIVNRIKRIAIIALASDDELVETLVLKGGNAIDLAYRPSSEKISRTSFDLDYSLVNGDFDEDEETISNRIKKTLEQTFLENEYVVIDYKFLHRPKRMREDLADFWGGYKVEFKVVERKLYDNHKGNITQVRNSSISVNPSTSTVFEVEFSKFEYVGEKRPVDVDGYTIYVYTPEMIVFEKLRAICQQLSNYKEVIPSFTPRARARDFYDIHLIMEMREIDLALPDNLELIKNIFQAKKVPVGYIKNIRNNKTLHLDNWQDVKDTISPHETIQDFDYYFNFVLVNFENLTFL